MLIAWTFGYWFLFSFDDSSHYVFPMERLAWSGQLIFLQLQHPNDFSGHPGALLPGACGRVEAFFYMATQNRLHSSENYSSFVVYCAKVEVDESAIFPPVV